MNSPGHLCGWPKGRPTDTFCSREIREPAARNGISQPHRHFLVRLTILKFVIHTFKPFFSSILGSGCEFEIKCRVDACCNGHLPLGGANESSDHHIQPKFQRWRERIARSRQPIERADRNIYWRDVDDFFRQFVCKS
jgi:hypothetical protein